MAKNQASGLFWLFRCWPHPSESYREEGQAQSRGTPVPGPSLHTSRWQTACLSGMQSKAAQMETRLLCVVLTMSSPSLCLITQINLMAEKCHGSVSGVWVLEPVCLNTSYSTTNQGRLSLPERLWKISVMIALPQSL